MRLSIDGLGSDEINEIKAFAEWILKIGNGDLCDILFFDELDESLIKISCDLQLHTSGDPIKAMVSAIYPGIEQPTLEPSYFKERAIVTPKNITVTEINNFILGVTHGPQRIYLSSDSIDASFSDDDNINLLYPLEFINQLEFSAPIMLLRNLSPMIGLCNGTRLITTQLADRVIEAQIITGSHIGDRKYLFYPLIQARVCRVWMSMQNGHTSSFNCLLVDHQDGAIQGSSKARDAEFFNVNIIEGCYIEIKDFYTYENRAANVVDHEAIIDLKSDTKIVHLDSVKHDVPRYHFNLTDFAHVLTKGRGSRILTDVLGRLKAIQPIEKILVQGHRLEDKKEFIIENIRGEDLRVTLWGDVARNFDDNIVNAQESPIIVVFAGFRVTEFRGAANLTGTAASLWYFNPNIPEVLPYKQL
ncbi:replication protein DNA-binding [Salix suchowensis]|nr:replication protein DNA-binding [Salix suchowensis]